MLDFTAKLARDLGNLTRRVEALVKQVKEQEDRINKLEQKRKPGRPKAA